MKLHKHKIIVILVGCFLFFSGPAHAGNLASAKRILKKSDRFRGVPTGLLLFNKLIHKSAKKKRTSVLQVKVRGDFAKIKYLAPANNKGDIVLMNSRKIWYYRKGVKKPLPLTPRQRLLGNAAVGDILNTRYSLDYKPVSISSGVHKGKKVHILELRPKRSGVTYDRIRYFIEKGRGIGVHAEFYSLSGKILKRADFRYKLTRLGGRHRLFLSKAIIRDPIVKTNKTTVTYLKPRVKRFPASEFSRAMISN